MRITTPVQQVSVATLSSPWRRWGGVEWEGQGWDGKDWNLLSGSQAWPRVMPALARVISCFTTTAAPGGPQSLGGLHSVSR